MKFLSYKVGSLLPGMSCCKLNGVSDKNLFYNEPELDAGIDPGMALTPFFHLALDVDQAHNLLIVSQILYR